MSLNFSYDAAIREFKDLGFTVCSVIQQNNNNNKGIKMKVAISRMSIRNREICYVTVITAARKNATGLLEPIHLPNSPFLPFTNKSIKIRLNKSGLDNRKR